MKLGGFQRLLLAFAAILCFVLASPSEAFGQSITVSGTVFGTDGPEVGVVVTVVGGGNNSITDQDGHYSIQVPDYNSLLAFLFRDVLCSMSVWMRTGHLLTKLWLSDMVHSVKNLS